MAGEDFVEVRLTKFGEELAAYVEKRRVRRQPDVEAMEALLEKSHLSRSIPIPMISNPIK